MTSPRGSPSTVKRSAPSSSGCGAPHRAQTSPSAVRIWHRQQTRSLFTVLSMIGDWHRASDDERGAAATGSLHVRVLQVEARGHQFVPVIEDRAVEVEEALAVDDQLGARVLEDLVAIARLVEVHLVGEPRATPTDDLHAQTAIRQALLHDEPLDLLRGRVRHPD